MKKFIALALTLAMLVSCLVFTASAESGVVVALQGPATAQAGETFQVEVRVTDANKVVGGVQGVIDVTGATVVDVQVNSELQNWNKTTDNTTIYKTTDNDITFAALNSLADDTHATRLWFKVTYQVVAEDAVSVNLKDVKVSDKSAALINDVATSDVAITVVDPVSDPVVTLNGMGMLQGTDNVEEQALMVNAGVSFPNKADIAEFGVVFYPTSLLGGAELTVNTSGAVIAKVTKENTALFNSIVDAEDATFNGLLMFGFSSKTNALKFLGTKVTARVYYKTTEGDVVYSSNNTVGNGESNKYIKSGTAKKAGLNVLLDNGAKITDHTDEAAYNAAVAGLSTSNADWEANREYVLKYVIASLNK